MIERFGPSSLIGMDMPQLEVPPPLENLRAGHGECMLHRTYVWT